MVANHRTKGQSADSSMLVIGQNNSGDRATATTKAFQHTHDSFARESLKAGTPQYDEEQQQICANLRNVYIKCQYFVLPCRTSSGLLCFRYIDDIDMYNDLKERGYM